VLVRAVLGTLLLANVIAALILFRPWGSSPEEMERELGELRSQVKQKQASVERLRTLVEKSRTARDEGGEFMAEYFMDRRTASSTIVSELKDAADEASITQEQHTFSFEPVEGSEDLQMMTISGDYEGKYADLVEFINLLDRSPRFLILDTLTASPERTEGALSMNFKMNAFVVDKPRPVTAPQTNGNGDVEAETQPAEQPVEAPAEESQTE
jgi:type IV pilus assembly protein PilO